MFPELMNRTITLYTASIVNEKPTWYRQIIDGVFLNSNKQYIQSKTGASIETNNVMVIPFVPGYVSPKEWNNMPNDLKGKSWTISASDRDFYVIGEALEDIPQYREQDIKKMYENYSIKSVDVKPNFGGGVHRFVVMGV